MGRQLDALEKIHETRLTLIETIKKHPCNPNTGESAKAQSEALDILEKNIRNSFEHWNNLTD